jgi:prepilin-type N-terminal cleavage/methylation domain-containing protein
MNERGNPAWKERRRAGGFTLIEMMIAMAILAILMVLSMVAYDAVGRRGALQNAAFDLQGVLNQARTRATSRNHPVWVVFHPRAGRNTFDNGSGAYLVVEDRNHQFSRSPTLALEQPLRKSEVVSEVYYLEDYGRRGQVSFGALNPGGNAGFGAPFANLVAQTCSFCAGDRGAIVFFPMGNARFVDGTGTFLAVPNQSMALRNQEGTNQYLFAISGPAAYIAAFSP